MWMTKQEVIHMNNYCVETSNVTGKYYEEIYPDEEAREYHLNGIQAVSYARIRYTAGNDMKRTQRQRVVINKIIDKVRNNTMSRGNLPFFRKKREKITGEGFFREHTKTGGTFVLRRERNKELPGFGLTGR